MRFFKNKYEVLDNVHSDDFGEWIPPPKAGEGAPPPMRGNLPLPQVQEGKIVQDIYQPH